MICRPLAAIDGDLAVVETNPVWCAGFLSAPQDVLAAALLASQGREHVIDPFVPDAGVQFMLERANERAVQAEVR